LERKKYRRREEQEKGEGKHDRGRETWQREGNIARKGNMAGRGNMAGEGKHGMGRET
jgi:hypothetical protein